jgi:hypothetical protein
MSDDRLRKLRCGQARFGRLSRRTAARPINVDHVLADRGVDFLADRGGSPVPRDNHEGDA